MKKQLFKTILGISLLSVFFGCASAKTEPVTNDDYSDTIATFTDTDSEESQEENLTEDEDSENKVPTIQIQKDQAKKKGYFDNLLKYGNKGEFASVNESSVFTRGLTGNIAQKKSIMLVNIEDRTAGYGSNYLTNYYIVQFNEESREKLRKAYDQYLQDFENKRLNRKSKKTFKSYGTVKMHIDWGTLSNSTPNNADGTAYVGYEFIKGSPYFTIQSYPMLNNIYDPVIDAVDKESLNLKYYFTKAQAKDFIYSITEEIVAEICMYNTTDKTIKKVDSDEY